MVECVGARDGAPRSNSAVVISSKAANFHHFAFAVAFAIALGPYLHAKTPSRRQRATERELDVRMYSAFERSFRVVRARSVGGWLNA